LSVFLFPKMRLPVFFFFFLCATHRLYAQDSVVCLNQPLKCNERQILAPAVLITGGLLLSGQIKHDVVDFRNRNLGGFYTNADDVLAFTPILAAYSLDAFGVPSRNDFWNRSAILFKGELMMLGTVSLLKNLTNQTRPDGSNQHSFPSSHTAQAFLAATFLSQEYKHQLPWIPYAAYAVAGTVASIRIGNNKHYISDVLVGAGIGILSQKVSYWTHRYRWGKNVPRPIIRF
jgi:membrane-associated phospholipid phosphatase